jgi:hypothetical protein
MSVKAVRTINNQMVIGPVVEVKDKVTVINPFSLIPTKDGLTLIPYDIDLTGYKLEQITFKGEHVLYVTDTSEQLAEEYLRILEGRPPEGQEKQETQEDQPEQEAESKE